jgi:DNA-binding transcriptional regulator GbsR (MarR family)
MVSLPVKAQGRNSRPDDATPRLEPLEVEVIQLFVQLSRLLGQPRSLGEIYGLLFISARPLAMDDIMARLGLSKGSASQGLKFLRNLGAVRMIHVAADRRAHYEAVAELRKLAGCFLRENIEPQLSESERRLNRLALMASQVAAEDREHAGQRIGLLRSWSKNGRRMLPLVLNVLGD